MLEPPLLTKSEIDEFKKNGFVTKRGGYSPDNVRSIQKWTDELLMLPEETGKHWVYYEENLIPKSKSVINRIENIAPFHKGFQMLSQSLKPSVHQLLGEEPTLFKEKINFKLSGGSGFKAHQDSQAGWNKYADFFISALVSIDESTLENGCLEISKLPTSKLVFDPWEPLSKEQTKHMEFVPITTKPGDLIFFDCFAPHQSSKNNTKKPRRLYYATYNRLSAGDHLKQYYADKHESYPPDIDRAKDKNYTFRV